MKVFVVTSYFWYVLHFLSNQYKLTLHVLPYILMKSVGMFRMIEVIILFNCVKLVHAVFYTWSFTYTQKKKLRGVKSEKQAGQLMGTPIRIQEFNN